LKGIAQWVEAYRKLWEESFERLGTFLESTQLPPKGGKKNARK
jgi:hypothetical protein